MTVSESPGAHPPSADTPAEQGLAQLPAPVSLLTGAARTAAAGTSRTGFPKAPRVPVSPAGGIPVDARERTV
ncbi:hypothetical protein ACIHAA_22130 [Streptomyces sp. NPDC052040]|uniref:hypothetical protein n=1 Tax=unclassified Streptomyces TaxID=2593676 RepID=UPI0037D1A7AA